MKSQKTSGGPAKSIEERNRDRQQEPIPELPPELDERTLEADQDAPITEDILRGATPDPERAHNVVAQGNPGVTAAVTVHEAGGEFAGEPDPDHGLAKSRKQQKPSGGSPPKRRSPKGS
jgi:hypothetical protein